MAKTNKPPNKKAKPRPQPSLQLLPKKMWPISNSYVFSKVMQEHTNLCHHLAERLIGQKIESIKKLEAESVENTILSRGVRFDAYLKASGSLIDMEMQTVDEANLVLRNAYYQAWLTRRALKKGEKISDMPKRFVIFICTFDPLGKGEALYRIKREAKGEDGTPYDIDDGEACLVLNTKAYQTCKTARIAGVLKYIETGKINEGDNLMTYLEEARIDVHNDEDWVRGMNIAELDKLEWQDILLDKGRAEGQSAERAREAALLEAMSARGKDATEILSIVMNGNLDTLYQEYGIE